MKSRIHLLLWVAVALCGCSGFSSESQFAGDCADPSDCVPGQSCVTGQCLFLGDGGPVGGDGGVTSDNVAVGFEFMGSSSESDLFLGAATLRFDRVRLDGDTASLELGALEVEGPSGASMVRGTAQPGIYSRLSLVLDSGSGLPTAEVRGVHTDSGNETPFVFLDREDDDVEFRFEGVSVTADSQIDFIVEVQVSEIFEELNEEFDGATVTKGEILIDEEDDLNTELAEDLHANLLSAMGLDGAGVGKRESEGEQDR